MPSSTMSEGVEKKSVRVNQRNFPVYCSKTHPHIFGIKLAEMHLSKLITACGAVVLFVALTVGARAAPPDPATVLKATEPGLAHLLAKYPSLIQELTLYATRQNFRAPFENMATVVHELVHIDSRVNEGFYIEGTYYEPYLSPDQWPRMTNKDVLPFVRPSEQSLMTRVYARDTPANTLANVLDELNAYSHVAKFVCVNEPSSGRKQVENISGLLALQEAYLRTL